MNDTGKVFVGTHHRPKGRRWIYGQFSDVALPAAQLLLGQSGLNPTERGNPIQVVRAIASIVTNTIFKVFLLVCSNLNIELDRSMPTKALDCWKANGRAHSKMEFVHGYGQEVPKSSSTIYATDLSQSNTGSVGFSLPWLLQVLIFK